MKTLFGKKGQMSVEMLLITGIIIMLSISVFSYYTRIMDTTTAMEIIEIETLKQLDAMPEQYFIKAIKYSIGDPTVDFCIELEPNDNVLATNTISDAVVENTGFEPGGITITQNPAGGCQ